MTPQQRWFSLPVLGGRQPVVRLPSPCRPVDGVIRLTGSHHSSRSAPDGTRRRAVAFLVAGAGLVGALVLDTMNDRAEPSASTGESLSGAAILGARLPGVGVPAQRPASAADAAFLQAYHRAGLPAEDRGAALELGRTVCGRAPAGVPGDGRAVAGLAPSDVMRVVELARTSLCPAMPTG